MSIAAMYRFITAAIMTLVSPSVCWPDEQSSQLPDDSLKHVQSIRVTLNGDSSTVEPVETPLLRFGEPTRGNERGSLWAWGRTGRPLAICEIYHNMGAEESWVHAMTLTSSELLTAQTPVGPWMPQTLQVNMVPLADAPAPDARSTRRLQQMRQLVRPYAAHELWDPNNSRYELRLLSSPLHRYADPGAGIVDGAVFAFAHGTNPEILVLIEAQKSSDTVHCKVGFAPSGSAEMHVALHGEDVWSCPRAAGVTGRHLDPYWLFVTTPAAGEPFGR